jgi:hypothetical protein
MLRRVRFSFQKCLGRDKEARRANPTLESSIFEERYLKWVESVWGRYALYGIYYRAIGLNSEDEATVNDSAVHANGTCTTVAIIATFFGACELQYVS